MLKVFKGALVVLKVEKVGNLYRLKGSTHISEAAIVLKKRRRYLPMASVIGSHERERSSDTDEM